MAESSIVPSSLHVLLSNRNWKDAEALLINEPSSAFVNGTPFNILPLVTSLMHDPPVWIVDSLIDANPAALTKSEYGILPLRVAIRSQCSTNVIKSLIREEPDAVKCFGVSGKTPLHLAILYNGDLELIDTLLNIWPDAAQWRDRDGWYVGSLEDSRSSFFIHFSFRDYGTFHHTFVFLYSRLCLNTGIHFIFRACLKQALIL